MNKYLLNSDWNETTVTDNETGEVLKKDENVTFEVHDTNAALYIRVYNPDTGESKTTGPIICWDSIYEELYRATGDEEWLSFIEYEDEE